ncbi:hypothetical protein CR205_12680 [Alteribacter lacisalsi]|uniref:Inner membrane protein YgaP-like transmembrane domain-containing protein n=1 Tax=Alteribacter lacisalsi TaxID=2045244 RepID=A0A2W0H6F7_9BACI|nr:DUF2892 domain-containing protein [Alteribacter lacisalsi]PYZ96561.1 hypothetical protein CR205_12680 [Alteribacter lacisalsi]
MIRPNIGLINALIRIAAGFTILAWATARLTRKPKEGMPLFVAIIGSLKIAEGITRFCPVTYAVEEGMENMDDHRQGGEGGEFDIDPLNPS